MLGDSAASVPLPPESGVDANQPPLVCSFGAPQLVLGLATDYDIGRAALSADGFELFFGMTTDADLIYRAVRSDRGATFSSVQPVNELNSDEDDTAPFLGFDGLRIYFHTGRDHPHGVRELWWAQRSDVNAAFEAPTVLEGISTNGSEYMPWLAHDELTIYFTGRNGAGSTPGDLWVGHRPTLDAAFESLDVITELNTDGVDESASLSADELTIYFASDRDAPGGDRHLWRAERQARGQAFSAAERLEFSSDSDDTNPVLTDDGTELFFSSDRNGRSQLWRVVRECH